MRWNDIKAIIVFVNWIAGASLSPCCSMLNYPAANHWEILNRPLTATVIIITTWVFVEFVAKHWPMPTKNVPWTFIKNSSIHCWAGFTRRPPKKPNRRFVWLTPPPLIWITEFFLGSFSFQQSRYQVTLHLWPWTRSTDLFCSDQSEN